jgi:CheY-like chemotaxis protein
MDDRSEIRGQRLLLVEDEYLIAADLAATLEALGVEVIGPVGSVAEALTFLDNNDVLDAAVLDINLGDEFAFPIADRLKARGIPFVFTTGYDVGVVPDAHSEIPRCEKPVDEQQLMRCLSELRHRKA